MLGRIFFDLFTFLLFYRSPPTNGRRPSLKHCSKLKARDISSCEISICDTVNPFDSTSSLCPKKHTSVSFGSLPTSNNSDDGEDGEDEENDKIHVLVEDGHPEHQNQSSSSLSRYSGLSAGSATAPIINKRKTSGFSSEIKSLCLLINTYTT